MKVRANAVYTYRPCVLDVIDGRTTLASGTKVRVKNLRGCPPCNTMGHAHVVHPQTGEFIGLVCAASLFKTCRPNAGPVSETSAARACSAASISTT